MKCEFTIPYHLIPITYVITFHVMRRQALSLTYGHFFAEFLEHFSPVRLSLFDQITCVGLRYGPHIVMLRGFSWKRALLNLFRPRPPDFRSTRDYRADLPTRHTHGTNPKPIMGLKYSTPSPRRTMRGSWNINHVSIACGIRHRLRTD